MELSIPLMLIFKAKSTKESGNILLIFKAKSTKESGNILVVEK
jgi:hypothetical protein